MLVHLAQAAAVIIATIAALVAGARTAGRSRSPLMGYMYDPHGRFYTSQALAEEDL